jgi:hypothetical protein
MSGVGGANRPSFNNANLKPKASKAPPAPGGKQKGVTAKPSKEKKGPKVETAKKSGEGVSSKKVSGKGNGLKVKSVIKQTSRLMASVRKIGKSSIKNVLAVISKGENKPAKSVKVPKAPESNKMSPVSNEGAASIASDIGEAATAGLESLSDGLPTVEILDVEEEIQNNSDKEINNDITLPSRTSFLARACTTSIFLPPTLTKHVSFN